MNSLSKSKLKAKRWQKLQTKAYRDAYAEAQLSIEIPFQIRALRKARGWTQAKLAKLCGIPQARISHIEQPGRDPLSLRTLYRLSSAFDVGLLVQFVTFSELVRHEAEFHPETFSVSSFKVDQLEEAAVSAATHVPLELGRAAAVLVCADVQLTENPVSMNYHRNCSRNVFVYKAGTRPTKEGAWIKLTDQGTKMEDLEKATLKPQNPLSSPLHLPDYQTTTF